MQSFFSYFIPVLSLFSIIAIGINGYPSYLLLIKKVLPPESSPGMKYFFMISLPK
jgi:hypothetical protein